MYSGEHNRQGNAEGSWILVDMINPEHYALVSIGDDSKAGGSLRKSLDERSRELLLERVRYAGESGEAIDEVVEHRGESWQVRVRPIISPTNRLVLGAQAVYARAEAKVAPRPLIGAMEWRILDGGRVIETVWDDDMFEIYGLKRSGLGSATGNMTDWVGSLVAPEDRARMKVIITGGITAPDSQRHVVAYRINAGDAGKTKYLEATGRVTVDEEGNGSTKWLRGLTREVKAMSPAKPPATADMESGALLRATFDLARTTIMLAIDTEWWQIFMTNPAWASAGLQLPHYGYIPHVVHPDDMADFRTLCETGLTSQQTVAIRFLHTDGTYSSYMASSSSGRFEESDERRYVIAALTPVEVA